MIIYKHIVDLSSLEYIYILRCVLAVGDYSPAMPGNRIAFAQQLLAFKHQPLTRQLPGVILINILRIMQRAGHA